MPASPFPGVRSKLLPYPPTASAPLSTTPPGFSAIGAVVSKVSVPPQSPFVFPSNRPTTMPRRHSHSTRLASHLRHISAAAACGVIIAVARAAIISPTHCPYHGNAFNPDTSKLAEYHELCQSREGHLWQSSNTDKIGRLAQGFVVVSKGTNTIFLINIKDIL